MRWPWSKPQVEVITELCDDCGRVPAKTFQDGLFLCANCAWGPSEDDDEPDYYDDGEMV